LEAPTARFGGGSARQLKVYHRRLNFEVHASLCWCWRCSAVIFDFVAIRVRPTKSGTKGASALPTSQTDDSSINYHMAPLLPPPPSMVGAPKDDFTIYLDGLSGGKRSALDPRRTQTWYTRARGSAHSCWVHTECQYKRGGNLVTGLPFHIRIRNVSTTTGTRPHTRSLAWHHHNVTLFFVFVFFLFPLCISTLLLPPHRIALSFFFV
jgi:hypothetical protein